MDESCVSIIFFQNGKKIIEYTDLDKGVTVSGKTVLLHMTPEETSYFKAGGGAYASVQINLTNNGIRRATRLFNIPIHQNLKAEAML